MKNIAVPLTNGGGFERVGAASKESSDQQQLMAGAIGQTTTPSL